MTTPAGEFIQNILEKSGKTIVDERLSKRQLLKDIIKDTLT